LLHLTLVLFGNPLDVCTKTFKRAVGLSLWDAAHERATDERAHWSQRCSELVAVVKPCATVLHLQDVFAVRTRTGGAAALPYGQRCRLALDSSQ
jgi:hypothetical protein